MNGDRIDAVGGAFATSLLLLVFLSASGVVDQGLALLCAIGAFVIALRMPRGSMSREDSDGVAAATFLVFSAIAFLTLVTLLLVGLPVARAAALSGLVGLLGGTITGAWIVERLRRTADSAEAGT